MFSLERMQATNDLRAILNAAEQAVGREDAAAAERLLREALALQESSNDSPRDEVAKTLNNLAVVCEMTGKIKDAETCYRRAYSIAMASLPPSDPFVTTSRENLEEFCKSHGLSFERPRPTAVPAAKPAPAPSPTPAMTASAPAASAPAPPPASRPAAAPAPAFASEAPAKPAAASPPPPRATAPAPPPRPTAPVPPPRFATAVPAPTHGASRALLTGAIVIVMLVVVVMATRSWFATSTPASSSAPAEPAAAPAPEPPPPTAAAAPTPAPVVSPPAPGPDRATPPAQPAPAPVAATTPEPPAATVPPRATTGSSSVDVVSAQVCRRLTTSGTWRCEEASATASPGTLYYFTRVASTRDTSIEHRWYFGERLYQRVELDIRPNQSGYRTYSRNTIPADRKGTWKVEMRSADGRVLHEETFTVR